MQLQALGHEVRYNIGINRRLSDPAILRLALKAGEIVLSASARVVRASW